MFNKIISLFNQNPYLPSTPPADANAMTIEKIPMEILEGIFQYLIPENFNTIRLVCATWDKQFKIQVNSLLCQPQLPFFINAPLQETIPLDKKCIISVKRWIEFRRMNLPEDCFEKDKTVQITLFGSTITVPKSKLHQITRKNFVIVYNAGMAKLRHGETGKEENIELENPFFTIRGRSGDLFTILPFFQKDFPNYQELMQHKFQLISEGYQQITL